MSASAQTIGHEAATPQTREILRYAFGSAIIVAFSLGINWPLAMLTPVLALMFLGSPAPCPSFAQGFGFVATIAVACLAGVLVARFLLPYPSVYIPIIGLILLWVFYATPKQIPPFLKLFLLLALTAIPFLGLQSMLLATFFGWSLVVNGITTVVLVWFVYGFFPDRRKSLESQKAAQAAVPPSDSDRFRTAMTSVIVVFPMLLLFFFFEWTSMLTVLIFTMILALQPGFATNFKAGGLLILANIGGGLASIIAYELLVIIPVYVYMLLLVILFGLFFGSRLFSDRKAASLYGSAFSTFLLIIGMTTSGESEADAKVYMRIIQIMLAVIYIVVASGVVTALIQSFFKKQPKES